MGDWGHVVFWAVGIAAVWTYVVAPLMLVFLVRQPGGYTFRRVGAGEAGLPPEVVEHWEEAGRAIEGLGFREAARVASEAEQRGYVRVFEHAASGDVAAAMVVIAPVSGKPPIVVRTVEFNRRYEHGLEIATINSVEARLAPNPPELVRLIFPQERDVARLYRAHLAAVRLYGGGRVRALPGSDGWIEEMTRDTQRGVERLVGSGWFVRRRDGSVRPTVVGAMMVGWRNLPPMRQVRARRSGRREREVLRAMEAGVG